MNALGFERVEEFRDPFYDRTVDIGPFRYYSVYAMSGRKPE